MPCQSLPSVPSQPTLRILLTLVLSPPASIQSLTSSPSRTICQIAPPRPSCGSPVPRQLRDSVDSFFPLLYSPDADIDHLPRRMSTSTASVPDTESSIASRPDKGSPSSSPQPVSSDHQHSWSFHPPAPPSDDKSPDPALDNNKVQLPSIFTTFEDPFRNEIRRASLPGLSSDSPNTRYRPSPYPHPSARRSHIPISQSNLGSYHFPSPLGAQDTLGDKSAARPRLDTHLSHSYGETSPYPATSLSGSTPSSTQLSSSTFTSPLTPDLRPHPATTSPYIEGDGWANSPSAIVRPTPSPDQPPLKYDDTMRHSSFSGPLGQPHMYANTDRLSAQQDRRLYPTHKSDDWPFSNHQEFVLPPGNPSYNSSSSPLSTAQQPPAPTNTSAPVQASSSSPTRSPQQPPAPSTLVDRPTRKRGKLPKETTDYLKAWLHRHSDHPYPSEEEKKQLCHATGLSMSQVSNWMINVRPINRLLYSI